jgi:hypothetical protein
MQQCENNVAIVQDDAEKVQLWLDRVSIKQSGRHSYKIIILKAKNIPEIFVLKVKICYYKSSIR